MDTKKNFLLIAPKNPLGVESSFPPLGLATIASHIPENYNVQIIDEGKGNVDLENVSADIVGISANTLTARRAYDISFHFMGKGIPTILGGIHPTVVPEEAKNYATSIVSGNGEPVMEELLLDFENGGLKKIYSPAIFDIAQSVVPRRDLLRGKYSTENIQTSRGCQFSCKFCSVHKVHGGQYRVKPLEVVHRDLENLSKSTVLFVDDNLYGAGSKA